MLRQLADSLIFFTTSPKHLKTEYTRVASCKCENMVSLKSVAGGCRSGEYYQCLRPVSYKKCGKLHVAFKDVMRLRIIRAAKQRRKNRALEIKHWIRLGMKALQCHHVATTSMKITKLGQNQTWLRCVRHLKVKLSKKIATRDQMQKLALSRWERCKSLHEARCRKSCTLCNKERRRVREKDKCTGCRRSDRSSFNSYSWYGGTCTCSIVTYHCDGCGDDYEEDTMKWSARPCFNTWRVRDRFSYKNHKIIKFVEACERNLDANIATREDDCSVYEEFVEMYYMPLSAMCAK